MKEAFSPVALLKNGEILSCVKGNKMRVGWGGFRVQTEDLKQNMT